MKARKEFGEIVEYPQGVPSRPREISEFKAFEFEGVKYTQTIFGLDKRPELWEFYGFKDVNIPADYNSSTQQLSGVKETETGFEYKVVDITAPDIEEIREQKLYEFNATFDQFTILISRCQFSVDPADSETLANLNIAIATARAAKKQYVTYIKSETDPETLNAFRVRDEDVAAMKKLFEPFE